MCGACEEDRAMMPLVIDDLLLKIYD
jgi:hypothetical protein